LLWFVKLAGNLGIHCIRRQIDLARPRDCAIINEDLLEKPLIPQRCKRTYQFFPLEPYAARQSVFEPHEEAVLRFGPYFDYVPVHRTVLRSGERFNLRRRHLLPAEPPVFQQFLSMYHRPFPGEVQSPGRQFAFDGLQGVDVDRCLKLAVSGVKVLSRGRRLPRPVDNSPYPPIALPSCLLNQFALPWLVT
jgi:hypothetical protein